jgi:hypothetical protein
MNFWIFKTNPAKYDIDERLRDPDPKIAWLMTRYRQEIQPGDFAFIWRAGEPRGIIAVILVQSNPQWGIPGGPGWIVPPPHNWRVRGSIIHRFPIILSSDLKTIPGLEKLSVFHGYQAATNFRVTPSEGILIAKEIYRRNPELDHLIRLN